LLIKVVLIKVVLIKVVLIKVVLNKVGSVQVMCQSAEYCLD